MTSSFTNRLLKLSAILVALVVPLTILVSLNFEDVRAFVDLVRDRDAVIALLDRLGVAGPLVLMALVALQILIPSLPAEPPMIAGAYAYGFAAAFLMNWLVSVAATQAVFYMARRAGRPFAERIVPRRLLDRWTDAASEKGTLFYLIAFAIPPIPNDILIYVAGLSRIDWRHFFLANLIGRMPMVALLSLVGASGLQVTPAMGLGLAILGVLMVAGWWYLLRRHPGAAPSVREEPSVSRKIAALS